MIYHKTKKDIYQLLKPNPMCIFHKKKDFFLFGLHGERRQWGLERVHQEVDQYFFFVMWYIISTYFLKGNRMRMDLGTSGTCWPPWWTSTMRSRASTSRSWSIFFFVMWYIIYTYFLNGNRMRMDLGTSGTYWPLWWTTTMMSRSSTSRSW